MPGKLQISNFLPSVLSRLVTDDGPLYRAKSDFDCLKQEILQNIELILNSRSHADLEDLEKRKDVYFSVLGMGVKDFCGVSHSDRSVKAIVANIKEQIIFFEPRLDAATLDLKIKNLDESKVVQNCIQLEIFARVNVKPYDEDLKCVFTLDLESGTPSIEIKD